MPSWLSVSYFVLRDGDVMKILISTLVEILNTSIVVFGFTLSLLDILLFVSFGSIAAFLIGGLFK